MRGTSDVATRDFAMPSMGYRIYVLALLTLMSTISAIDRQILDILVEPIRIEFRLSDGEVGALNGLAYAGVYALAVIPLARLADRWPRKLVISICVLFWSLATTLSSFARSYAQLFAARVGVGLGEAGLSSPGPAMLSDLFPRSQRGTVTSIYMTGPAIGIGIAYGLGGWIATEYGWRAAFLMAGIPGLIMVPIFYLTVRNVPKGMSDGATKDVRPLGLWQTLKTVLAIRTLAYMVAALIMQGFITQGVQRWIPAYLTRSQGLEAVDYGAQLGTAIAVGNFVGHLIGGPLADLLGRRDMRWQFGIAVFAVVGVAATNLALFTTDSLGAFYLLAGLLALLGGLFAAPLIMICTSLPPVWARATTTAIALMLLALLGGLFAAPLIMICTSLPPVWARATTTAIALMGVYLFGYGLGPAVIGAISDLLEPVYGALSLRYAVLWMLLLAIPSALLFMMAAKHYRADLERSAEAAALAAAQPG